MNVGKTNNLPNEKGILILPLLKGLNDESHNNITTQLEIPSRLLKEDFKGDTGEFLVTYTSKQKIIIVGLGDKASQPSTVRAFRSLSKKGQHLLGSKITIDLTHGSILPDQLKLVEAIANGLWLGTYQIGKFKSKAIDQHIFTEEDATLDLMTSSEADVVAAAERGIKFASTQMSIMDLVNAPSNKKLPTRLAEWAVKSGKDLGYSVEVFDKEKITSLGMGGLLAVNQGSAHPPTFTIMDYTPSNSAPLLTVGLVGKGVTFDTGGLSLKPSSGMPLMKSDMGGAAAVLGSVEMAAKLQLPIRIIGIVPSSDNSVGSDAYKPSDVITSFGGQTIEIIDTDAEGRLLLADGLGYITKHYQTDVLIDLATLTGSAVRTLGYEAAALFSKNEDLRNKLFDAGMKSGEKAWPLPLWDEYMEDLQSDVADIKNLGTKPMAGAIIAGKFLEFFTNEHPSWAHLDIAGVAFSDAKFSKYKSATAFGIRLLITYFERLIVEKSDG